VTALTQRLGLRHPIIQAPLAGGGDTPELVAAVGETGALGFIGAAYLTPAQIVEASRAVRARTARPFGINLFAPLPAPEAPRDPGLALERIAPFHAELGLPAPALPAAGGHPFDEQLAAALESGASVFSFTFGILPAGAIEAIKARGMFLMGTATTVEEAVALEKAGVDALVAQGSEAGGHRGTFAGTFEAGMVGTMALVPQIVDAVAVPVLASGGIADGRGLVAALALGAAGVLFGTRFVATREAAAPGFWKTLLLERGDGATVVTAAVTGLHARYLRNAFCDEYDASGAPVLPALVQSAAAADIFAAASARQDPGHFPMPSGESLGLIHDLPGAGEVVQAIVREARDVLAGLPRRTRQA